MEISPVAARVLGCLIEKQRTTPDLYPLSLNSLVAACNQTTNRWPVVRYDEGIVQAGLDELRALELVRREKPHGGRAIKFSHLLARVVPMDDASLAVVGVLLLRGPQTPGELKTRTERLHAFDDFAALDDVLGRLAGHEDGPIVEQLARERGHKESRWRELLSRTNEPPSPTDVAEVTRPESDGGGPIGADVFVRIADLEAEVARLRSIVDGLAADARQ